MKKARCGIFHNALKLCFVYFFNSENISLDTETDVESGECQSVNPVRLSLVGRSGVMGENADGCVPFLFGKSVQQILREFYFQKKFAGGIRKAAFCLRMGIAVGNIGFHVEDGGAIHQVCAAHMEDGAKFFCEFHTQQAGTG